MKVLVKVKLSPHKYKTDEGYLICEDAVIARTGKQQYQKSEIYENCYDDEIIEVDRKPEQVFDEKTLASFENKPLTIEHPEENVTPENYKEYSAGFIRDVRKGRSDDQDVILANIVVTDPEAISAIESGNMTDLSCGYDCDITQGDNPEQINIRGNHVALCEQGRAGIARIVDSQTQDSMKLCEGCTVQDFGKKPSKYKVKKIVGNTVYAKDLVTGDDILLRADKLGHDYAVVKSAAQVKDAEKFKYVIWRDPETNTFKGTSYSNYKASNADVSKIQEFKDKGSFQEVIVDLLEHPESGIESRDEIIQIGDMIFDSIKCNDAVRIVNGEGKWLAEDESGDIIWESNLRKPGVKLFNSQEEANKYVSSNNIEEGIRFIKDSEVKDAEAHSESLLSALKKAIEEAKDDAKESLNKEEDDVQIKDYSVKFFEYRDVIIQQTGDRFIVEDYDDEEHIFNTLDEAQDFIDDYFYDGEY